MALYYYDDALVSKLKSWVRDVNVKITAPDETRRLFEYVLDQNNDKEIPLPLIAIRREPDIELLNPNKQPITFDGVLIHAHQTKIDDIPIERCQQLNGIPIKIGYQIDIYTRYASEADEYLRNFVFNIINYPKVEIEIPYNDAKFIHRSNIRIVPTIEGNSDIPERLIPGQFTRVTIKIYIDDAYLFSAPVKDSLRIESSVEAKFKHE